MSETIYFEDPSARIGNAWFVLRRGAYRVQDVNSVELRSVNSNRRSWHLAIIAVIAFIWAIGIGLRLDNNSLLDLFPAALVCTVPFLLILIILVLYAFYVLYMEISGPRNPIYLITLRGSFGEGTALASLDKNRSEQIAAAMREALDNKIPLEDTTPPPSTLSDRVNNASLIASSAYISDGLAEVAPLQVKFGETVYSIPEIKAAKANPVQINKVDNWLDVLMILSMALWMILSLASIKRTGYPDSMYDLLSNLGYIAPFTYFISSWVKTMRKSLTANVIELSGTFGRVNAFVTLDEQQASLLATNINNAVKQHKATVSGRTA